jgi:hypothetical protein
MSRREYLIQKGLQVQLLNKEAAKPVATSPQSFSSSKISKANAQEVISLVFSRICQCECYCR